MVRALYLIAAVGVAATLQVQSTSAQFIIDGQLPAWGVPFEEVHAGVTKEFRDPRSAQYKGMSLVPVDGGNLLCGWVNWKDANGGYGPFVAFSYKATRGGVREVHLGTLDQAGTVPSEVSASGCDEATLLAVPGVTNAI